ncbi:RNA methyltransferase [Tenacibaculum finnmarkense genomovar finnmarkense]|uniref:TrmH family RNA methyltransferase n=1 Tax=Tenacibaculum finnmarkense TaxID=2781243 RepID=UPI001E2B1C6C|nr:RNA methyltransferase [Tenacibaculum finnmarkense]MCD8411942.1 RNA methyltransferase [Tenacibaculum finnmarkense genomovar ulcerans]MCD8417948.1 RNA methyltransferase [Tenacibaculum finnmarkense genomovar finnmarkense]MCG8186335.1 RNA methyltransferase [Tenacibaculum finnmarkense genomovar finnmarkense]MCG8210497.1 RNA methyltransferase [Tenacibaculum finnmarkense genomovar finnmarkense]MCG8213103.1 RNA methyltransferase [Tenacibaculum finnmarkense genomovar finnmarkense]
MKQISSIQNPYIKDLLKLQDKSRERKKRGLFLVEGQREISLVIKGNYQIDTILFVPDMFSLEDLKAIRVATASCIEITKEIYQKIAYRDTTEGVISVVKAKNFSLDAIQFETKNPLILVFESIEKPGNIGAMLRTADAANVDAVFIANPKTDLFNPNIVRSSVGCVFTNQIGVGTSEEIIDFLQEKNINIYSATLQNSNEYHKNDYTQATALVVGTEATGLTQIWRDKATQNINIPMQGQIDSMNVSVAAAILTFEAKRQREFKI